MAASFRGAISMRQVILAAIGLAFLFLSAAAAQALEGPIPVDLELVIAVDVSASMDREEFLLQRSGYREAIRHPDFVRAILSGDRRRIAATYVEWSGRRWQKVIVPWRLIDGQESAEAFAVALDKQPLVLARGTSISAALTFGAALFEANGFAGDRKAIDVSGDGPNNYGQPVTEARDAAVASGIVINGLPIVIAPSPIVPDLARYYSECVIGGPGAFMLPVANEAELALSIRRKLILEVAGRFPAGVVPVAAQAPIDCLAGEKQRALVAPYYPGIDD
jgi:Protein of unknown function (DUF1194)